MRKRMKMKIEIRRCHPGKHASTVTVSFLQ